MKELIKSILSLGCTSPRFKEFYSICVRLSMSYLSISKNRFISIELQRKLDISLTQLARDCIADLFEIKDSCYIHINNYFYKKLGNVEQKHDDEIKVHLAILIKSKTNQQLTELREYFGEIYFKIKKAVSTDLTRKNDFYKEVSLDGNRFLYICKKEELDFNLPQVEDKIIMEKLYEMHLTNYQVPKVMKAVLEIVEKQEGYLRAIRYKSLLLILKSFYLSRMNDHQIENVEYY
jgi:hypothetical protein